MESKQKGEQFICTAQVNGTIVESPVAHDTLNASKRKHPRLRRGKNRKIKYAQVWDWDNLRIAEKEAGRGKNKSCSVVRFHRKWWRSMVSIQDELVKGNCGTSAPTIEGQTCQRKNRQLTKVTYCDHIRHHAFMQVTYPVIKRSYYYESSASIKGRGIHYSVAHLKRYIALLNGRVVYWVQLDFAKCYHYIKRDGVQQCFNRQFNDKKLREMAHGIIYAMGESNGLGLSDGTDGMGIGLYPIQPLVNFRYNELDREIARRVDYNLRYCDNIVMLDSSVKRLWEAVNFVFWYADNVLHQPLHTNVGVQKLDERHPIDFVGYKFYPTYTLLRDDMKYRFKQKVNHIKDEEHYRQMLTSYRGWLMHCDGLHLWQTVTGMKSFAELKQDIEQTESTRDGQRYFDVEVVRASALVDRQLIVEDFIEGVETKNGKDRMCILVTENGTKKKFLTNNPRLKDMMVRLRDINAYPFTATLRQRIFNGNKIDYYFE